MRTPRGAHRVSSGWQRRLLAFFVVCTTLASPVYAQTGESVEYYALDALGSVRVVFDATGNILSRMDFTPFGGELFSGANLPDRRFAGLFRDGEAGLDYAQARSYQVRTGRFSTPDPVYAGMFEPQRWNRYAYARNNPTVFVDPDGRQAVPRNGCVTSVVVGGFRVECPTGATSSASSILQSLLNFTISVMDMFTAATPVEAPGGDGTVETSYDEPGIGTIAAAAVVGVLVGRAGGALSKAVQKGYDDVIEVVERAVATTGPGRGAVYGTRVHTALKNEIKALDSPYLRAEVSFKDGFEVKFGTPGSVRLDVVQYGPDGEIIAVYDLKTGSATLSDIRIQQILGHLPKGTNAPILKVAPPCPSGGC